MNVSDHHEVIKVFILFVLLFEKEQYSYCEIKCTLLIVLMYKYNLAFEN